MKPNKIPDTTVGGGGGSRAAVPALARPHSRSSPFFFRTKLPPMKALEARASPSPAPNPGPMAAALPGKRGRSGDGTGAEQDRNGDGTRAERGWNAAGAEGAVHRARLPRGGRGRTGAGGALAALAAVLGALCRSPPRGPGDRVLVAQPQEAG